MSIYALNRLCHQVMHDRNFRQDLKDCPEHAIASYDLTPEERDLLLAGEVGQLHLRGVNAFLLGYLTRFDVLGLKLPIFNERMRAVVGERPWAKK